ncbi:triacylglycerol lipase OBL1-like [Euphorbia lathyris]|uniref:triacylglycerol lipase OBL1-like n=1 Tax=Euphorbia lathyris TaxID=212925 RepID=UPI003313BD13
MAEICTSSPPPNFLIVNPKKGKKRDTVKYMVGKNVKSGMAFLDSSEEGLKGGLAVDHRWILLVSIIICRILNLIQKPLRYIGLFTDFFLNLLSQNGGFSGILHNFFHENQKANNTQVFICCDKPKDANLIVVSFRGTEPFNAQDWSTDFDFSWYEIPKVGKLHVGFLEALSLGNRSDATTFQTHLRKKHTDAAAAAAAAEANMMDWPKKSAYYVVAWKLKKLLKIHKNAKFVVTGHSLGGALAILFPSVLVIQEENEMLQRLLNVYTFGQPRIGDSKLGTFIEAHLNYPVTKYFRVVYCNDMVPRVPFDDKVFAFKHFGTCLYYDSHYFGKFMDEEPNRNFFGLKHIIPMRMNAIWEVLRSLAIRYTHGPDYEESWFCTLFRALGLVLPGIAAHSPVDYINSVRLGRERVAPLTSLKSFVQKI